MKTGLFAVVGVALATYLGYHLTYGSVARADTVVVGVLALSLVLVVLPLGGAGRYRIPIAVQSITLSDVASLAGHWLVSGSPPLAYVVYRRRWFLPGK